MTQEDKDLLLQDLSARLPYGVKCVSGVDDATLIVEGINPNCCGASEVQVTYERSGINFDTTISAIKPYLFPLSSMTEEQKNEYHYIVNYISSDDTENWKEGEFVYVDQFSQLMHFYHINHLDYMGLIPKGLANDATGLNIY